MANSKRARSGKPPTRPRALSYPRSDDKGLQSALERIRQAARLERESPTSPTSGSRVQVPSLASVQRLGV